MVFRYIVKKKGVYVMNDFKEFNLSQHFIDLFNQNAEYFNNPKSEEKVLQTIPYSGVRKRDFSGMVAVETIELPVMENPKHFFRFFSHKKLQLLFEACPEAAAKLGTRPWKYILMYSPEYADQCPCINNFSQEEKALILHRRPELEKYLN